MSILQTEYPFLYRIVQNVYPIGLEVYKEIDGAHDINWTKEFELFYNNQPNSKPYVKRLFLKKSGLSAKSSENRMGFVHIRPLTDGSEVSEFYIKPPDNLKPNNRAYIKCLDLYDEYSQKVTCTPYIMPDAIFGMCIHASVWICLKILHRNRMVEESLTIPNISILATGRPFTDKQGLRFVQTARILRMCKTQAFYINSSEANLTDNQILMDLYAYVESGLPVILGVDIADLNWWNTQRHGYHSIVAIGHTMVNNSVNGFIFHDESRLPYQVLNRTQLLNAWHTTRNRTIRELLVAVPPQVTLAFHIVYQQFSRFINILRTRRYINLNITEIAIQPILMSSQQLIIHLLRTGNTAIIPSIYEVLSYQIENPPYFWVIFIHASDSSRENLEDAIGYFIRDATQNTDLRIFFQKETKTSIYQIKNELYSIKIGHKRKRHLT